MVLHDRVVYAAGLFDGEGCVRVAKRRARTPDSAPTYSLECHISNTHRAALDRIVDDWGGAVYRVRPQQPRHRVCWKWYVTGQKALAFLQDVRPFTIVKSAQIDLAAAYAQRCTPGPRGGRPVSSADLQVREGLYMALREAKR